MSGINEQTPCVPPALTLFIFSITISGFNGGKLSQFFPGLMGPSRVKFCYSKTADNLISCRLAKLSFVRICSYLRK